MVLLDPQTEGASPPSTALLGADAFAGLDALAHIEGVVLRGQLLDRAALDAVIEQLTAGR